MLLAKGGPQNLPVSVSGSIPSDMELGSEQEGSPARGWGWQPHRGTRGLWGLQRVWGSPHSTFWGTTRAQASLPQQWVPTPWREPAP